MSTSAQTIEEFRVAAAAAEAVPVLESAPIEAPATSVPRLKRADLARAFLSVLEAPPLGLNRPGAAVLLAQLDRELGPELLYMTDRELLEAAVALVARSFLELG